MKPLICVPMGDPAGVGPEILAAAAAHPAVQSSVRLVAVGEEALLRQAALIMKVEPELNLVAEDLANLKDGALNLLPLGLVKGLVPGQVCAAGGRAAFGYIAKSVELALAGRVDALATTPINKESLKAAGIPHIGHTEMLADLTGARDPLTMFQARNLRIFFLTRHLSLLEACRSIKRERVLDYIRRCLAALERLGLSRPTLAVAGLNPHSGEGGLFGREEMDEIAPAIQDACKEGYAAVGPKPADSVFHFALKGAWDAVLSLYHDQGHIAAKMVDFDRTISLTIGLPFLRTSVDHGTAFDIAGQGRVSPLSLVEAIRLAAIYAPNFQSTAGRTDPAA